MDRIRPGIARSLAAAAVSVFLVAGAAFAANAVLAPASPDPAPAATFADDATASPAETAEPTETAEPDETAEPSETPEVEDQHDGGAAAPTSSPDDHGGHDGGDD